MKKIPFDFDDGSENAIFESDGLNKNVMSVGIRFVHFGGKYVYDYWNDVVHQPERFIPYGYIENNICKKFFSYYTKIDILEAYRLEETINGIKEDVLIQHFHRKKNYMFLHLKESIMYPILKLIVPGITELNSTNIKKIKVENV
jgi:hypothetical protein